MCALVVFGQPATVLAVTVLQFVLLQQFMHLWGKALAVVSYP
jgi:hypothetical protein